jgi:hypothetical protein
MRGLLFCSGRRTRRHCPPKAGIPVFSPSANRSAITGTSTFIFVVSIFLKLAYGLVHVKLFGPLHAVFLRKLPGCAVVFDVGKNLVQFARSSRLFHHNVAAHIENNCRLVNVDGALLNTGVTGSTGPQLFSE